MADGTTVVLLLVLPQPGGSENTWGEKLNADLVALDALFHPSTGHDHVTYGGKLPPLALLGAPLPGMLVVSRNPEDEEDLGTWVARTIAALANGGLAVANGNGVDGNPTLSLALANLTAKATPVDADLVGIGDSAASNAPKKATRAELLTRALISGQRNAVNVGGAANGAVSLDTRTDYHARTATGTVTWTFLNPPASGELAGFVVELTNGGAFTQNWPASVDWPGGSAPALTVSGKDLLRFLTRDGGTTWLGAVLDLDTR